MTCRVCGSAARRVFAKEANVSCGDYFAGRRLYPEDVGSFALLECSACGFAWFEAFNTWTDEDFRQKIYNADYHLCDPPVLEERPARLAEWLLPLVRGKSLLDYGGGEGLLARKLAAGGIAARSFDPYYGEETLPDAQFDIVTSFEVVEHVPDQDWLFGAMARLVKPDGLLIFSTLLRPARLDPDWWYASPRNGHAVFHTEESLAIVCARANLSLRSLSREMHVAAFDPARLGAAAGWTAPRVSDTVRYGFSEGWHQMTEVQS
ncbi:MAG: class I SAM-dependent methyltransferase [Hyphomonas sp.]